MTRTRFGLPAVVLASVAALLLAACTEKVVPHRVLLREFGEPDGGMRFRAVVDHRGVCPHTVSIEWWAVGTHVTAAKLWLEARQDSASVAGRIEPDTGHFRDGSHRTTVNFVTNCAGKRDLRDGVIRALPDGGIDRMYDCAAEPQSCSVVLSSSAAFIQ